MIMKTNWGTFSFFGMSFFVLASIVLLIWFFCLRQLLKGRLSCFNLLGSLFYSVINRKDINEEICSDRKSAKLLTTVVPLATKMNGKYRFWISKINISSSNSHKFIFNNHLDTWQRVHLPVLMCNIFFTIKKLRFRLTSREINLRRLDGYACEIFSDLNWFDRFDGRKFRNQRRRTSKSAIN